MKNTFEKEGIYFTEGTPEKVVSIINLYMHKYDVRLRIYYGDKETGRCWMEEHDTQGYIGRSTGNMPIPLLISRTSACGGGAILTDCIVKITAGKHTLYQHERFNMPAVTVNGCEVLFDGEVNARFENEGRAQRYAAFMKGERNSK